MGKGKGQVGEDIGEYEGMVKGTNEAGHCFMICEKLLEEGWQGDVLLQPEENVGYEFGDTIRFTAFKNGQGKLGAKNATFISSSYIGAYVGTVKSYNEANGYGFIACDETKELGHADVFLHAKHSGCETARTGDKGASKGGWPESSWEAGGDDSSWGGASAGGDWQSAAIQA